MGGPSLKSPMRHISGGTLITIDWPCVLRNPSKLPKKNVRSNANGPPSVPPYWCWLKCGSFSGLVKRRASNALFRKYWYTLPWMVCVPDFVTTFTWPVPAAPSSAE